VLLPVVPEVRSTVVARDEVARKQVPHRANGRNSFARFMKTSSIRSTA
jgi:hypothetical protein